MGWDVLVVIIGQRSSKIAFGANKRGCQILLCGIGLQEGYPPSQTGISPIFSAGMGVFPPPCCLSVLRQQNITEHGVFAANEA